MTSPQNSGNQSDPPPSRPQRRLQSLLFNRTTLSILLVLLAGTAGGVWWAWIFVHEQLVPLVQEGLTKSLKRPVRLGKVERFTLTGIRIGPSSLPATPTDPDYLLLQGVEVNYNLWRLISTRRLYLSLTVYNPYIYAEQAKDGTWISPLAETEEEEGFVTTEIETVRVEDADLVLVPNPAVGKPKVPVTFSEINGIARFAGQSRRDQRIFVDFTAQSTKGGTLVLKGESRPKTAESDLQVQAQNIVVADIGRLLPLPLQLQAGRANANLRAKLVGSQAPSLFGTVDANQVTLQLNGVPRNFAKATGRLRFQDKTITLEKINLRYGDRVPVLAQGSLNTSGKGLLNLKALVRPTAIPLLLNVLGVKSPFATAGLAQADLQVRGTFENPLIAGTVTTPKGARIDRVNLNSLRARFELVRSILFLPEIQVVPTAGGQISGNGRILLQSGKIALNFQATDVPGDPIAQPYTGKLPIRIGAVSATARVFGSTNQPQIAAEWQAPAATYPGSGEVLISGSTVVFRDTVLRVAGGTVSADGRVVDRALELTAEAFQIPMNRLAPGIPGVLNGTVNLTGDIANLKPNTVRGTGRFRVNIGQGTVLASGTLANGQLQATVQSSQLPIDRFAKGVAGTLNGTANLTGNVANLSPNALQGEGRFRIDLAAGSVFALGTLNQGRLQATLQGSQIELSQLAPGLRGSVGGTVNVAANLSNLTPAGLIASGQLSFPQGLALPNFTLTRQPLTALFAWDGRKIRLEDVRAPGLRASGLIYARLQGPGAPEITNLDLNVQANNYDLRDLPLTPPNGIQIAGKADFNGRITGTPTAPNIAGTVALNRFVLNDVAFEPVLRGSLKTSGTRNVNLQLQGDRDRIFLALVNNRPRAFDIRRGEAIAIGRPQGDGLAVEVSQFPIALLNLRPIANLGAVTGTLSGKLNVNLDRLTAAGQVEIDQPTLGLVKGDRFRGNIRYANNTLTLTNGELQRTSQATKTRPAVVSLYTLNGTLTQGADPRFNGQVTIAQGQLSDVSQVIELLGLDTLLLGSEPATATAGDLQLAAVGDDQMSLLNQLRRFSEIEALLQQQQDQRDAIPLPKLSELEGLFSGTITASGSLRQGIKASFNLQGQDWQWGKRYRADRVVAEGELERGILTLVPLRFESGETVIAFRGQIGGESQSGQLEVKNLPIENVTAVVPLPVDVTGKVNGSATIAGNVFNPRVVGEFRLVDATLNGTPVETAQVGFGYKDALLNFGSTIVVRGPEPIAITGEIPLPDPEGTEPIKLTLNVKNEGLALLNLFSQQVTWVKGSGQVEAEIRGTRKQPQIIGTATVQDAVFKVQALPEPLTDVDGQVRFAGDRIVVESLNGKFSQGQVLARGVLPIARTLAPEDADNNQLLSVALKNLALNLKGLYRGRAEGDVLVTGTALAPQIGGQITLQNGQVLLPDETAARTPATAAGASTEATIFSPPRFNNLQLTLGERILITRQPILNFVAAGSLLITGTLDDPLAAGTIRLKAGQVNIFTTQFNLAGGYEHTAQFNPRLGLDPVLDVRLITSVPEVTRSRITTRTTTFSSADVEDVPATNLGSLQTVRIQARVSGPASQIFNSLELTSSPSRSRTEIIALLGGGFVSTLGRGDDTLALANLAGSALLTQIQTAIGGALGLSEFRLFPTVVTSREARTTSSASTLGLAAEVGVDITNALSASVLKVLTTDQSPQFGLRYRVNDQIQIRGSTDFSGDSRAVVEYESRF